MIWAILAIWWVGVASSTIAIWQRERWLEKQLLSGEWVRIGRRMEFRLKKDVAP